MLEQKQACFDNSIKNLLILGGLFWQKVLLKYIFLAEKDFEKLLKGNYYIIINTFVKNGDMNRSTCEHWTVGWFEEDNIITSRANPISEEDQLSLKYPPWANINLFTSTVIWYSVLTDLIKVLVGKPN